MGTRRDWLVRGWAVALAVLLLGPALGFGYALSYDMVWVPDLALRPEFLGLGSGLPRAVPSDAVVAVLDEVVPGMLLQKVVLLGSLVAAGLGAARLAPATSLVARLAAVSLVEWNPFVAERLLMGHWPVLVGYAVLPWLVLAGSRGRRAGRVPPAVWWLLPLGSLSAGAGMVSAVVLLAFGTTWRSARSVAVSLALVLAANAPWLVSGLLHASTATSDAAGAEVFALRGEGALPAPLAALGLGGIWNAEVVPGSRTGPLAWVALVVLAVLAALGARAWVAARGRRHVVAAACCWLLGWGLATLTWAAPGPVGWAVAQVPGAGVLRDGSRWLALCVPALVGTVSYGVGVMVGRMRGPVNVVAWGAALVLVPVAVLPDAALGLAGRLRAVEYPSSYAAARAGVDRAVAAGAEGDVLLLPFTSYRAPAWNARHKVLDPLGRYLSPDYVASDRLLVSGRLLRGEDPRAAAVERALAAGSATQRARRLAAEGIALVAVDRGAPSPAPEVAGTIVVSGDVRVTRLSQVRPRSTPAGWVGPMTLAWLAFLALPVSGVVRLCRNRSRHPVRERVRR